MSSKVAVWKGLTSSEFDPPLHEYSNFICFGDVPDKLLLAVQEHLKFIGIRKGFDLIQTLKARRNMLLISKASSMLPQNESEVFQAFSKNGKLYIHFSITEKTLYMISVCDKQKLPFCWKIGCRSSPANEQDNENLMCLKHQEMENKKTITQLRGGSIHVVIPPADQTETETQWNMYVRDQLKLFKRLDYVKKKLIRDSVQKIVSLSAKDYFVDTDIDHLTDGAALKISEYLEIEICKNTQFVQMSYCPVNDCVLAKFPDFHDWIRLCDQRSCFNQALPASNTCAYELSSNNEVIVPNIAKQIIIGMLGITTWDEINVEKAESLISILRDGNPTSQDGVELVLLGNSEDVGFKYQNKTRWKLCANFAVSGCKNFIKKYLQYCGQCSTIKPSYWKAALVYKKLTNKYRAIKWSVLADKTDQDALKKCPYLQEETLNESTWSVVLVSPELESKERAESYQLALVLYATIESHLLKNKVYLENQLLELHPEAWDYLAVLLMENNLTIDMSENPYKNPLPESDQIFEFTSAADGVTPLIYKQGRSDDLRPRYYGSVNGEGANICPTGGHHEPGVTDTTNCRHLPNDHRRTKEVIAKLKDPSVSQKYIETVFILGAHCAEHLFGMSNTVELLNDRTADCRFGIEKLFPELNRAMYKEFNVTIQLEKLDSAKKIRNVLSFHSVGD